MDKDPQGCVCDAECLCLGVSNITVGFDKGNVVKYRVLQRLGLKPGF